MAFDFPASPTVGQLFTPAGGPTYQWSGTVWALTATGLPDAPSDGGEYVRVNSVWRLKHQIFSPAGTAALIVPVPSTAKAAHIFGFTCFPAAAATVMQLSLDGSTFFSGATDYVLGGTNTFSGSRTPAPDKQPLTTTNAWSMTPNSDNVNTPAILNCDLIVGKAAGQLFSYMARGYGFQNSATLYQTEYLWTGYTANTTLNNATQLGAFKLGAGANFSAGARFEVTWIY